MPEYCCFVYSMYKIHTIFEKSPKEILQQSAGWLVLTHYRNPIWCDHLSLDVL